MLRSPWSDQACRAISCLGAIELLVEIVGAERVIFGTDCPMRDPRPQFGWLAYTHLTESDKLKILGANMRRILERFF